MSTGLLFDLTDETQAPEPSTRASTLQVVETLKAAEEDFEWYPTTPEIIGVVARDIHRTFSDREFYHDNHKGNLTNLLDIGAGDGRVLLRIADCVERMSRDRVQLGLFAIEIATTHLHSLPKEITVVGTDFMEQTLVDKTLGFAFSNPPYSEFERWAVKLIREASVKRLYLVIPKRWDKSIEIKAAIKGRNAKVRSLGEFNFENADRKARAVVDVLCVSFDEKSDSFDTAIEDMLPELQAFDKLDDLEAVPDDDAPECEVAEGGESLIQSLVKAYDAEIAALIKTYSSVVKINPRLLKELNVTKSTILNGIRAKIVGRKEVYWKTLFDRFAPITKRMANKQRQSFLSSLKGKAVIDFTESNIYAMLIWVSKWSNDNFDEQLVEMFKKLSEFCNVVNYKSNERVWAKGDWRYYDLLRPSEEGTQHMSQYKLEYRIVLEHSGGICGSQYSWEAKNGLVLRAFEFLQDLITVANNLGFDCNDRPDAHHWTSGTKNTLTLSDGTPLVAIRAYKNQNMHMQFNPKVMLAINVEAGRLLGWLRDPEQTVREMNATKEEAEIIHQVFNSSFRIGASNILRLGHTA